MPSHFLAIHHESYDASTVFGVFDTFNDARTHLEAEAAKPDAYSSARWAEIEEWDGATQTANFERHTLRAMTWQETRYADPKGQNDE